MWKIAFVTPKVCWCNISLPSVREPKVNAFIRSKLRKWRIWWICMLQWFQVCWQGMLITEICSASIAATYSTCGGTFPNQLLCFWSEQNPQRAGIIFPLHSTLQPTVNVPTYYDVHRIQSKYPTSETSFSNSIAPALPRKPSILFTELHNFPQKPNAYPTQTPYHIITGGTSHITTTQKKLIQN